MGGKLVWDKKGERTYETGIDHGVLYPATGLNGAYAAGVAWNGLTAEQPRKQFGLCYRTKIGNDAVGEEYGYKLHIIYGAYASPSEKAYNTINDSPEAISFSWEVTTTPIEMSGYKPTATIVIDSTKIDSDKLTALEDILYGKDADTDAQTEAVDPRLPLPDEIVRIVNGTNNG